MNKIIAGLAIAIVSLSGAVSAQDGAVPAYIKYQGNYANLPGFVNQVIPDPDRSRDALEVARERDICNGAQVISANWRDDIVLAVRCPAGAFAGAGAGAGAGLPGALTGTALTTGAAVGLVAVVTVLVVATGGDGGGTTTTTTTN